MVFFTCNSCGTSVKKNQVENHTYQCRSCQSVSCMDCNQEFWGDEYKLHIKCISEDQKYGGKDYKPKESSNKGEIKQAKWIEHINTTLATKKISGPLSGLLEMITQYTNIPRKKSKFENFLANSLKVRNPKLISEAWEIFDQGKKNESEAANNKTSEVNGTPTTNGTTNGSSVNSSVKRSSDVPADTPSKKAKLNSAQNNKENHNEFNWCAASEEILQNYPSGVREKTLRKQVIAKYKSFVGDSCKYSDIELKKMFRNELKKNPKFSLFVDSTKS
ncbi:cell growth-regulating nucleolar protein-like isoform X2 [Argiope bruennichi]|nr:cell growth-regulating nucleolar protein-like isoform X2 [Argiope bruennichi]XP_055940113.1 cell growth-regulating nucleolar protein-like isoform X2 [Argiope bruennichi]XP_055940114.1 cell growth-regulating nucleolar protein-like isoform X2 [Argiope bruennichi]XP_055940115.1 cell growth-regulating nucleolar protein-like isoform X2 [Argiope bruennichi]